MLFIEHCVDESFNPRCDNGKLILIHTALYGRMSLGKCISTDLGYIGCKADALQVLDNECSGYSSCEVAATDKSIKPQGGCIEGLQSYLEVEYSCVDG